MTECVLDSSAILAWLHGEPGGAEAGAAMAEGVISTVNLAEVVTKLVEKGYASDQATRIASRLPCPSVPFDSGLALAAGALRAITRPFGLSLGDRACLALAQRGGYPVLTTDRAWAQLDVGVEIRVLR